MLDNHQDTVYNYGSEFSIFNTSRECVMVVTNKGSFFGGLFIVAAITLITVFNQHLLKETLFLVLGGFDLAGGTILVVASLGKRGKKAEYVGTYLTGIQAKIHSIDLIVAIILESGETREVLIEDLRSQKDLKEELRRKGYAINEVHSKEDLDYLIETTLKKVSLKEAGITIEPEIYIPS